MNRHGLQLLMQSKRQKLADTLALNKVLAARARDHRRLEKQDFVAAAGVLNCHPALLHAFADVESRATSYDDDGRLIVSYEPHKAFEFCGGSRALLSNPVMFQKDWRTSFANYDQVWHPCNMSNQERWQLIEQAATLAQPLPILNACGWGAFQVMGFNAKAIGFTDASEMIEHMYKSEVANLECAIRYLRRFDLIEVLRAQDFDKLALGYNGAISYSRSLRLAFDRREREYS